MNKYTYKPPADEATLRQLYESGLTQKEIADRIGSTQKSVFTAMRKFGLVARVAAKRDQTGERNSSWKGDAAGTQAFHRRLYALHGKPSKCSRCGTETAKHYYYANLTGHYENPNDYAAMCRSCHAKYDDQHRKLRAVREVKNART